MSELDKSRGYMQVLDQWIQDYVLDPLFANWPSDDKGHPLRESEIEDRIAIVKKAIREKVLESYHNGKAQATSTRKSTSYAKR